MCSMSSLAEIKSLPISQTGEDLARGVDLVLSLIEIRFKNSSRPKFSKLQIAEELLGILSYQVNNPELPNEQKEKILAWLNKSYDQSKPELVDLISTLYMMLCGNDARRQIQEKLKITKKRQSIAYLSEAINEIESHT